jgi:hypothetical protein
MMAPLTLGLAAVVPDIWHSSSTPWESPKASPWYEFVRSREITQLAG